MIGIIIGLVIMLADTFFIWRCCRVAGIVFTVLSVQPSAFTAICFGRTVDTFKHDKLPPDHLSIIIKDRLVREFIMLEFEVGQRIGIADILDGYVLNESHILSPILRCSGSPTCRSPEAHDEALLPEDLSSSLAYSSRLL